MASRLERRPLRFSTICAKNQELNLNIDKVTVILRLNSPLGRPSPVPRGTKFSKYIFKNLVATRVQLYPDTKFSTKFSTRE
jgi:hypothetical protein